MRRVENEDRYVIFAQPQNYNGPSHYYKKDGGITDIKDLAAQFYSSHDAENWAKENNIELTVTKYIGLETFRIH